MLARSVRSGVRQWHPYRNLGSLHESRQRTCSWESGIHRCSIVFLWATQCHDHAEASSVHHFRCEAARFRVSDLQGYARPSTSHVVKSVGLIFICNILVLFAQHIIKKPALTNGRPAKESAILYGRFCLVVNWVLNLSYRNAPWGAFFYWLKSILSLSSSLPLAPEYMVISLGTVISARSSPAISRMIWPASIMMVRLPTVSAWPML